jgi:FKBP-type peptidyl-prolyl cis-trans isomerase FkpA
MTRGIILAALLASAIACGGADSVSTAPTTSAAPYSQTDLVVGTGSAANVGNRITANYSGWLYDAARPDGKGQLFDSGQGSSFVIAQGQVISGWVRGVPGMRVGGQRRLIIPPELGYGAQGNGPIPPNATLVFDITLLGVQ